MTLDAIKKECYLLWRISADAQYTLKGREKTQIAKKILYLNFFLLAIKYEFYFIRSDTKRKYFPLRDGLS